MASTPRLESKVAVVTGGAGGLGSAVCRGLVAEGASVVVNDLGTSALGAGSDPSRAHLLVDEITAVGGTAIASTADISERDQASELVDAAVDEFGRLDILVNAAGTIRLGTILDTSEDDFDSLLRTHLRGYFNTSHFAAVHWAANPGYGRLINFASGSSLLSQPTLAAYSTAKTGVLGLTRSAANALVAYGVTANCVRPSASTAMSDAMNAGTPHSAEAAGTAHDPAHVVPLVVFLASPAAAHISGRLLEARSGRYTLWREPSPERVVERNFLTDPDAVYAELETALGDLELHDLPMPMPRVETLGNWREDYGVSVPLWT
jgi:3-oxoacyl-[acyl-carrier protein] reductase